MKIAVRFMYLSSAFAGVTGSIAVALGWEPPLHLIASAAFLSLCFAGFARDTQFVRNAD